MYNINATTIKDGKVIRSRDITIDKTLSQLAEFFYNNGSTRIDDNNWVRVFSDDSILIHTATPLVT